MLVRCVVPRPDVGLNQGPDQNRGGSAMAQMVMRHLHERERRIRAAWEGFIAGSDDVRGVPSLILLSWYRSRDVYRVDPLHLSPPHAVGVGTDSLVQHGALTQLGGIAATLADRTDSSLTTVTDGHARILGSWGAPDIRRRAEDNHIAPLFTWSESATGTNAMGTALGCSCQVSVRGPEHWCACLHDWSCDGLALADAVTGQPIGALTISFWRPETSRPPHSGLAQAVAPLLAALEQRALRDGMELARAFLDAEARATNGVAVIAVDQGARILAANHRARELGSGLPAVPAIEPVRRVNPECAALAVLAEECGSRARADSDWSGRGQLDLLGVDMAFEFRPVISVRGEFVGLLLVSSDGTDGDPLPDLIESAVHSSTARSCIVGTDDTRLIILSPGEIRYAEADRHVVWLVTDRGRIRALNRGLENVERELLPFGFIRVHRGYLVNLQRIREVDQGFCKGTLTVSTQHHGRESIPVARRHVPRLRAALGI